ncbi:MAG: DM13 domain-containing protein [Nitrososphaeraceae archaeon]|nr:DM13 domain-containing protein [Nitrososphaeraceae archaeon]
MKNKTKIIIGIIVIAIVIPLGIYTISPLFINTEINEPLPSLANEKSTTDFAKFMAMTEDEKFDAAKNMAEEEENMIMKMATKQDTTINETMAMNISQSTQNKALIGNFIGIDDGIHNAKGLAKILTISNGSQILRLENFKSTNGPDVHLYLSNNKQANDFIDLGRLKANNGNQNYKIPMDIDFNHYGYVLIWCKPFSILFGSAQLN